MFAPSLIHTQGPLADIRGVGRHSGQPSAGTNDYRVRIEFRKNRGQVAAESMPKRTTPTVTIESSRRRGGSGLPDRRLPKSSIVERP